MGCRHRIAYLFLCLLHILILIALALTLLGCRSTYVKCEGGFRMHQSQRMKDPEIEREVFPSSFKGFSLSLNYAEGNKAGKIVFLLGVALSVVAFVLILLNICKCRSIKKWKKPIKKRFRWIFIVLLLMAVALIVPLLQADKSTFTSEPTIIMPLIAAVIAVVEVVLVLCMLCCKPAKKKEKVDDDDDEDDKDNGHNRKDKKTGGKGSDGAGNGGGNNTIHVFHNIPGLRGDDEKHFNPFRMLHSTTPSNVYGSAD